MPCGGSVPVDPPQTVTNSIDRLKRWTMALQLRKQRKELSVSERQCCFNMLLSTAVNGAPKRGSYMEMAHFFDVERRTMVCVSVVLAGITTFR